MAFPQGVNFRSTTGYVTDGANETYELGTNGGSPTYPRTTPQGNTIGAEDGTFSNANRNAGVDRRLAGIIYTPTTGRTWRIDLPSAGTYNVRIAAGDYASINRTEWAIYDDLTKLADITTGAMSASQRWKDANNTEYDASTWPTSNAPKAFTFSSSICRLKATNTSGNSVLSHFYIEAAGGDVTGTLASTLAGASMSSAGTVENAGAFASTLAGVSMTASGTAGNAPSGSFSATLADASMSSSGVVEIPGSIAATLSGVAMSAAGVADNRGAFAASLDGVSMAASGGVAQHASGSFASTLGGASMIASGFVGVPPALAGLLNRNPKTPRKVIRLP